MRVAKNGGAVTERETARANRAAEGSIGCRLPGQRGQRRLSRGPADQAPVRLPGVSDRWGHSWRIGTACPVTLTRSLAGSTSTSSLLGRPRSSPCRSVSRVGAVILPRAGTGGNNRGRLCYCCASEGRYGCQCQARSA